MNQITLSSETDEIIDRPKFSLLSLIGLGIASIGALAFNYVQVMPFAVMGAAIGIFCLLTAKRKRQGVLTRFLASMSIALGTTAASAGYFTRYLEMDYELTHAKNIADIYVEAIAKGDMSRVYFLNGLEPGAETQTQNTELTSAVNRIKTDPTLVAIRAFKQPSQWEFTGEAVPFQGDGFFTYRLTYRDVGQSNKPKYWVYSRRNGRKKDMSEKTARWKIDKIEPVSN
jgi:hypothetical protein